MKKDIIRNFRHFFFWNPWVSLFIFAFSDEQKSCKKRSLQRRGANKGLPLYTCISVFLTRPSFGGMLSGNSIFQNWQVKGSKLASLKLYSIRIMGYHYISKKSVVKNFLTLAINWQRMINFSRSQAGLSPKIFEKLEFSILSMHSELYYSAHA